ncbi:uncharacterized protein LOC108909186 [Anoplophora glabripennis]|uniref:uncharacterized protein LOC108909186 n=1 Tax=Anoplophora glabripennis TaxID=217634 RepID=UPI0008754C35|nr:uncharacterized protein LOC108909186 [Anoplophora glabripennis]
MAIILFTKISADGTEPVGWIKDAVNQIIAKGTEDLDLQDQVAFSFCSKDFLRGEGWARFRPVNEITYDDIWSIISSVYQSNSSGIKTETFYLGVTTVKMPVGRGKGRAQKIREKYVFDFQKELMEYCISDVEILTTACLKFRQQLLETSKVCPFTEACTIASACNKVFRRNFLQANTIGIIPKNGYRWRDNQSRIAIQWLVWEERQRGVSIMHAAKGKETVLEGVKVDGYCNETNQIFEFYGCYYHGCAHCFKYNRNNPTYEDPSDTLERRFESTAAKTERLKNLGYDIIEIWECNFRHPKIYLGEECNALDLKEIDGLIKCKILPPQDLYHPVLPQKINNKLMFVLCRICGQQMQKNTCSHEEDERALSGTWVADEVMKALEKGYRLMEIYEVWN